MYVMQYPYAGMLRKPLLTVTWEARRAKKAVQTRGQSFPLLFCDVQALSSFPVLQPRLRLLPVRRELLKLDPSSDMERRGVLRSLRRLS
jgi:hypothetical protein